MQALPSGFTSTDAFQVLYPFVLFVLGEVVSAKHASRGSRAAVAVSISEAVNVREDHHHHHHHHHGSSSGGSTSPADDPWMVVVFGVIGATTLAIAAKFYAENRDITLLILAGYASLGLGVVMGTARGLRSRGALRGQWLALVAVCAIVCLGGLGCIWLLLHPTVANGSYAQLLERFLDEGHAGLQPFDDDTLFLGTQVVGVALVALAIALMLMLTLALLADVDHVLGMRPPLVARVFAGIQRLLRLHVVGSSAASLLLMVLAGLACSGIAFNWATGSRAVPGPGAAVLDGGLVVDVPGRQSVLVVRSDDRGSARVLLQRRGDNGRYRLQRAYRSLRIEEGTNRIRLSGRSGRALPAGRYRVVLRFTDRRGDSLPVLARTFRVR